MIRPSYHMMVLSVCLAVIGVAMHHAYPGDPAVDTLSCVLAALSAPMFMLALYARLGLDL